LEKEKEDGMQHTKRYMIIFNKWSYYKTHEDISEYDTMLEVDAEIKLLEEAYGDTPRPKLKSSNRWYHRNEKSTQVLDYIWGNPIIGEAFWGYLVVDAEAEKIVKWGNDCLRAYNRDSDIRRIKDWLFRKDDEVPKDYKWSNGEYEGWLQYRWGDGLNAVKYGENAIIESSRKRTNACIKHCNVKKKKYAQKAYNEAEEAELDKLNEEILAEAKKS
jgi:hypothetical protein